MMRANGVKYIPKGSFQRTPATAKCGEASRGGGCVPPLRASFRAEDQYGFSNLSLQSLRHSSRPDDPHVLLVRHAARYFIFKAKWRRSSRCVTCSPAGRWCELPGRLYCYPRHPAESCCHSLPQQSVKRKLNRPRDDLPPRTDHSLHWWIIFLWVRTYFYIIYFHY